MLTLNVSAPAALIQAFDPLLRRSTGARVIGVTSSVGRKPRAYWGAYGASKAAFETLLGAYGDEMEAASKELETYSNDFAKFNECAIKEYNGTMEAWQKSLSEYQAKNKKK